MNYFSPRASKRIMKSDAARRKRGRKKDIVVERTMNIYRKLRKARRK